MSEVKISCLTATHGRFSCLRVALACFLCQTVPTKDREIIILNNHITPLLPPSEVTASLCNIRIVNEPKYASLGDCRNRLLQLARGEFIRTWDDDDLYLPWTAEQGLCHINRHPAFKPARSWSAKGYKQYDLFDNVFEAAMTVRKDVAERYGYGAMTGGDEHLTLLQGIEKEGGCHKVEMGWQASYAYNWATPLWRISGSLGSGTVEERTEKWKEKNQDDGAGQALNPDFAGMAKQLFALATDSWRTLLDDEPKKLQDALRDYL